MIQFSEGAIMIRKFVLPIIALLGVLFAVYAVVTGSKSVPAAAPVAQPSLAPYATYVAGAGIIEARTENIAISAPVAGLVTEVIMKICDRVKKGDPLLKNDDRDLQAESLM